MIDESGREIDYQVDTAIRSSIGASNYYVLEATHAEWRDVFSSDGYRSLVVLFRTSGEGETAVAVPGTAEGFGFFGSFTPIRSGQITSAKVVVVKSGDAVAVDANLMITLTDREKNPLAVTKPKGTGERAIVFKSVRFRNIAGVPARVFTSRYLELEPSLQSWQVSESRTKD